VTKSLPRYDPTKTYRWNYDHAPSPTRLSIPSVPGDWDFCGLPVDSPLGIAAGPLLNGKWCLAYAELGFDVVTYKTVRSSERACYPLPNLQPVACEDLSGGESRVLPTNEMQGSWAVSFGMPSSQPEVWRRDIEWTREKLSTGKILCVSVVGTIQDGWTVDDLAEDYALCARWAVESGADCIETNFSCPNVSTCDGQLYHDADQSRRVAQAVRDAIGSVPLILKIGHLKSLDSAATLLDGIGDLVDGLAMTNSIATTVGASDDDLMFERQHRGICGAAIQVESVAQTSRFAELIRQRGQNVKLIGVGGISSAADVRDYLDAGAHACHLATAAMLNPAVGIQIREQLSV
jgi:dihydroorotate dehydrogenase (NAD+) catalytic subunit